MTPNTQCCVEICRESLQWTCVSGGTLKSLAKKSFLVNASYFDLREKMTDLRRHGVFASSDH